MIESVRAAWQHLHTAQAVCLRHIVRLSSRAVGCRRQLAVAARKLH